MNMLRIFTASAPRPTQSKSCNICLSIYPYIYVSVPSLAIIFEGLLSFQTPRPFLSNYVLFCHFLSVLVLLCLFLVGYVRFCLCLSVSVHFCKFLFVSVLFGFFFILEQLERFSVSYMHDFCC